MPQLKVPVTGFKISKPFGVKGKFWKTGFHPGVDFPSPTGTPVKAVWGGIISRAHNVADGYGLYIRQECFWKGCSFRVYYAHLSKVLVKPGDEVGIGDVIAESGASGNVVAENPASDGSHLHLEVRLWTPEKGKQEDPAAWVRVEPKFFDEET